VVPILVLCPWTLAPTAGIDSATSQEIANASASFSLELLQVLASVNEVGDSQRTHNGKHHEIQLALEKNCRVTFYISRSQQFFFRIQVKLRVEYRGIVVRFPVVV
jgi:hypothetical protein